MSVFLMNCFMRLELYKIIVLLENGLRFHRFCNTTVKSRKADFLSSASAAITRLLTAAQLQRE